ncbi:MAG: DUF3141 domain-containing protein [Pusillimonas sp.]
MQPENLFQQATDYFTDAWQRSVLYADVMRQRGNQYREHMAKKTPHVLSVPFEFLMNGKDLPDPVNYGLCRILPHDGIETDPKKRPFVVVDPRAGHGPGIGGFKAESEIGVAMRAGHPCYFIGFAPEPVAGQTVFDVVRAEAAFLRKVIELHPEAEGKPVVIGNCQAGWQVLMTAALYPDLFGPIIVAGAPVSYWAGWRGKNPTRYAAGMQGGTWPTALTSDLGAGKFDGAWLVQNFENLDPANTLWDKQYHLYANVDTEVDRYLGFEKYWGGHVYLTGDEMQFIADNLFVGNHLATAGIVTDEGVRVDLRNIRSPIVVFCSRGDNITPPPQALGWIPDLYQADEEIYAHNQTIVYAVHDSIGHLGIFVSGKVAAKEHQEFATNIDLIDVLPSGIYQAIIHDKDEHTLNADLAFGDYVLAFERRKLDDVRQIVANNPEDDWRFEAVDNLSRLNLSLYRSFVQPWVKAWVTPARANALAARHPLRLSYEMLSDQTPWGQQVARQAETVRASRRDVAPDNLFWQWQNQVSKMVTSTLDQWRDLRDSMVEQTFIQLYGSPFMQAMFGQGVSRHSKPRPHPGTTAEHKRMVQQQVEHLCSEMSAGGVFEAKLRALIYLSRDMGSFDERSFNLAQRLRQNGRLAALPLGDFKRMARKQGFLMLIDADRALATLPDLLEGVSLEERRHAWQFVVDLLTAAMGAEHLDSEKLELMAEKFGVNQEPVVDDIPAPVVAATDMAARLEVSSSEETVATADAPVQAEQVAPVVSAEPMASAEPVVPSEAVVSTEPVVPSEAVVSAVPSPAAEPVAGEAAPQLPAAAAAATTTKAAVSGTRAKQARASRSARGRSARSRQRPVQGDLYDAGGSDN